MTAQSLFSLNQDHRQHADPLEGKRADGVELMLTANQVTTTRLGDCPRRCQCSEIMLVDAGGTN